MWGSQPSPLYSAVRAASSDFYHHRRIPRLTSRSFNGNQRYSPFSHIPPELVLEIASHLGETDKQCLRLSCPDFLHTFDPPQPSKFKKKFYFAQRDDQTFVVAKSTPEALERLQFMEKLLENPNDYPGYKGQFSEGCGWCLRIRPACKFIRFRVDKGVFIKRDKRFLESLGGKKKWQQCIDCDAKMRLEAIRLHKRYPEQIIDLRIDPRPRWSVRYWVSRVITVVTFVFFHLEDLLQDIYDITLSR